MDMIFKAARIEKAAVGERELALINAQALRELSADEVFAFRLAACDNQVDREGEDFRRVEASRVRRRQVVGDNDVVLAVRVVQFLGPLSEIRENAPTDVAHVGSLVLGVAAPAAGIWALWRARVRVGWVLPAGALVLVVLTVWALATAGPS